MRSAAPPALDDYDAQVDQWVRAAILPSRTFGAVVARLPGVYPTVVEESLRRQSIILPHGPSEKLLRLAGPVPHPRDGDWRFHPDAHELFSHTLAADEARDVAILACPSLVSSLTATGTRVTLADSNRNWAPWLPPGVQVSWGDVALAAGRWPSRFDAAIMDPPWYPYEFARFMSVAAAMLKVGAFLHVSFPSTGTRPGMAPERAKLLRTARRLGLAHVRTQRAALRYATPFYEGCALAAGGLPVLAAWRNSDLVTFERVSSDFTEDMEPPDDKSWLAASIGRLHLRFRPDPLRDGTCDPRLTPLIEGDVLPSVSQRDKRRGSVVVWTSGNRVFGCGSSGTCWAIARATMCGLNPVASVEERLGRRLTAAEIRNVGATSAQLAELEALESQTYDEMHEPEPRI